MIFLPVRMMNDLDQGRPVILRFQQRGFREFRPTEKDNSNSAKEYPNENCRFAGDHVQMCRCYPKHKTSKWRGRT